jgi:hypothetical protein
MMQRAVVDIDNLGCAELPVGSCQCHMCIAVKCHVRFLSRWRQSTYTSSLVMAVYPTPSLFISYALIEDQKQHRAAVPKKRGSDYPKCERKSRS